MSNLHLNSTIFTFVALLAQPHGLENPLHAQERKGRDEIKRKGTDSLGDPLPDGAIARLGTARLRHHDGFWIACVAFSPDSRLIASAGFLADIIHLWGAATGRELRVLQGPKGNEVKTLAFSTDATLLAAAASHEGNLWIWEVATGKMIYQLSGNQGTPLGIAFLDRDKRIAWVGSDGKVIWWDVASGKVVREWNVPELWKDSKLDQSEKLRGASLSPHGKTLALFLGEGAHLPEDRTIICDLPGAKKLWEKKGCLGVGISSDGQSVAMSMPNQIGVYETATGKELKILPLEDLAKHHKERLPLAARGLAFSPDDKMLAAAILGEGVYLWDLATGKVVRRFTPPFQDRHRDFMRVAISPDGKRLLATCNLKIWLWDVATGSEVPPPSGHSLAVNYLQFSENGQHLISSADDGREGILWNTTTWRAETRWEMPGGFHVKVPVPCSPDYRLSVHRVDEGENAGDLLVCERASGKALCKLEANYKRISSSGGFFSPSNRFLVMPVLDQDPGKLWLLDVSTGKRLGELPESARKLCFAFSPNNKSVAWCEKDRTIHVFDINTGREQRRFGKSHAEGILDWNPEMTFSPDGRYLASWDFRDNDVHVWDVGKGKEHRLFLGKLPERIFGKKVSLAFSPDGRTLAFGSMGGEKQVQLWELATGKVRRQISELSDFMDALAFSPDGRLLATGSEDTTVLIWSLAGINAPPRNLPNQELENLWNRLGDQDAPQAYDAIWTLTKSPMESVPFLKRRLRPVAKSDRNKIRKFITHLDSKQFTVRDQAYKELEKLAELAETALRQAMEKPVSLEVRRRVETLLQRLEGPISSPEQLRMLRGVEALELIGTSESRALLKELADGAKEARLTQESKASLERLVARADRVP